MTPLQLTRIYVQRLINDLELPLDYPGNLKSIAEQQALITKQGVTAPQTLYDANILKQKLTGTLTELPEEVKIKAPPKVEATKKE